jgi:hypothetical protein
VLWVLLLEISLRVDCCADDRAAAGGEVKGW